MRRFAVYVLASAAEATCFVLWLGVLDSLRRDPVMFFEVLILGPVVMWSITRLAERLLRISPIRLGRLPSRIEEWTRLQAVMREEERLRRLRGA